MAAREVQVELAANTLMISGTKQSGTSGKNKRYYFRERRFGVLQRSFRLPQDVNTSNLEAEFNGGVLPLSQDGQPFGGTHHHRGKNAAIAAIEETVQ
ncbi:MAG: Hsp20 family protein [Gammaproteobacteria bacterium]|nr:Hsp20 family protein [Gammaproteobacteria bacterium]